MHLKSLTLHPENYPTREKISIQPADFPATGKHPVHHAGYTVRWGKRYRKIHLDRGHLPEIQYPHLAGYRQQGFNILS